MMMQKTPEELAEWYQSLNWDIQFYNREHDWENPSRLASIEQQARILSRLYSIVENNAKEIVDLREPENDVNRYLGRSAYYVSVDDGTILTGTIQLNDRNKVVIQFEQGNTTVGSILYLAD